MTGSIPSIESWGWETKSSIRLLSPLAMVCAWCKKVRAADGNWQRVERRHKGDHDEGRTSHGMCPACAYTFTAELEVVHPRAA
jgi:hypothetical protein